MKVFEGLKQGTKVLDQIHKVPNQRLCNHGGGFVFSKLLPVCHRLCFTISFKQMSIEDVEQLMDDTAEAQAYQDEINELLGNSLSR